MHTPTTFDELPIHETLLHPRTGEPLRALGFRANGDPIWPIMGGDGSEGDANDGDNQPGDGNDDDDDGGNDNGGNDDGDDADDGDDDGDDAEDDAEDKRVKKANKEAARYRRQLRETEQRLDQQGQVLDALRRALTGDEGNGDGDGEPDPAQLQATVEQLQTDNRSLNAQLAVYDLASEHDGNPSALLDSRRFMGELDKLDPADDDFRDKVSKAVKKAVDKDPKLRADQGSSRGGTDLPTGSGEGSGRRPRGIGAAVSARMGG